MPTYFITGTRRGLGFQYVQQLSRDASNIIIAHVRSLKDDLSALQSLLKESSTKAKIHLVEASLDSEDAIAALPSQLPAGTGIDVLLLNAARLMDPEETTVMTMTASTLRDTFTTNVIAPVLLVQNLFSHLNPGARIILVSTGTSSNGYISTGAFPPIFPSYNISKGALNVFGSFLAQTVDRAKAVVVMMDPGWSRTELGGPNAWMDPTDSAQGVLKVLQGITEEDHGKFYQYNGQVREW